MRLVCAMGRQGRRVPMALASLLVTAGCSGSADRGVIPATPLGRFATEWLTMNNSGDVAQARRFAVEHQGEVPWSESQLDSLAKDAADFEAALGPLSPDARLSQDDSSLVILVRSAKAGPWRALFRRLPQPNHEQVSVEVSPAQASAELGGDSVEQPMVRTPSGRPIVMVTVNGSGPLRFVIDIGTNVSLITPGALRAILPAEASRAVIESGRFFFDSLRMGQVRYRSGRLLVDDLGSELDGLLGLDVFAEVLLTLDYPASVVRVGRGALPQADGHEVLDFTFPRPGSPTIPFTLGGRRYEGVIDVGSTMALEVPESVFARLRWERPPVPGLRHSGPQLRDARARIGRLSGDAVIGDLTVQQPIVETLPGLAGEILIGQPALAQFSLTLDQVNRRVRLKRAGPAVVRAPSVIVPGFRLDRTATAWVVEEVVPATAAAAAGLRIGDTVASVNGKAPGEVNDFALAELLGHSDSFTLEVIPGGRRARLQFPRTTLVP